MPVGDGGPDSCIIRDNIIYFSHGETQEFYALDANDGDTV